MLTMTIDLDEPQAIDEPLTTEQPDVPLWMLLKRWGHRHPAAAGMLAGVVTFATAVIVGLSVVAIRWWPVPAAATGPIAHVFTVQAEGETTMAIRRHDGFVSRGELWGSEPIGVTDIVSLAVTVHGDGASCRLLVDGQLADEAQVSPGERAVTCLWTAQ